jgi:hypothetical protein
MNNDQRNADFVQLFQSNLIRTILAEPPVTISLEKLGVTTVWPDDAGQMDWPAPLPNANTLSFVLGGSATAI